jgi:hypothetical protein
MRQCQRANVSDLTAQTIVPGRCSNLDDLAGARVEGRSRVRRLSTFAGEASAAPTFRGRPPARQQSSTAPGARQPAVLFAATDICLRACALNADRSGGAARFQSHPPRLLEAVSRAVSRRPTTRRSSIVSRRSSFVTRPA